MYKIHSNQSGEFPITLSSSDYDSLSKEKVETLKLKAFVNMYGVWVPDQQYTLTIDKAMASRVHVISAFNLKDSITSSG